VVFPWILFLKGGKKRLSDIEYLSIKDFDGKRVDVDDILSITTSSTELDAATQTAGSGKDMYLAGANITSIITLQSQAFSIIFRLYVNGTVVETLEVEGVALADEYSLTFLTKGVKVAATQIIKITAQQSGTTGRSSQHRSKLMLFEEATGESPQIG